MSKQSPEFTTPAQAPPPPYPGYPIEPSAYPRQRHSHHQQVNLGNQPFPTPIQYQPGPFNLQTVQWSNSNFQTYLTNATSFHVKQKVELPEALIGWETQNKFTIMDQSGNKIFYAGQESDMCCGQMCSMYLPFTLTIKDKAGLNVIIMTRKPNLSCCGLIYRDSLQVSTPSGQLLGTVVENSILYPRYKIKDATGKTVLRIHGPSCAITCGESILFKVMNMAGATVGTVSREYVLFVRESHTDCDSFSISFPHNLDQSVKAVLLGAVFLIDSEFHECEAC
jgi:hypothetical protein